MFDSTDESFNDLIRTWPNKAIRHLYEHYYNTLVHIAERRTHDRKASEDIVQDILIEVWKKSELINWDGFLIGPYLINLVKKRAINFYYQNSRKLKDPSFILEELLSTFTSKESELIQSDRYQALKDIIATMPPRERECIEMRYFQEMSVESIAQQLCVTKKAVEKNITKGLKRLRNHKRAMY